jgi:FtsZ-binding cell division protein ZapB
VTELEIKLARKQELMAERDAEYAKEQPDGPTINRIIHELNTIEQQIMEAQQAREHVAAEPAEGEVEPQYDFIHICNFDEEFGTSVGNKLVQFIIDLEAARLRNAYQPMIDRLEEDLKAAVEHANTLNGRVAELQQQNSNLISERNQAILERDEFERRFQALATLENDKDAEIARLKEREEDLQKQLASAPLIRPYSVIEVEGSNVGGLEAIKRQREAEKALKPKITNKRWEDEITKKAYLAEDEDGVTVRIPRLEIGQYNEVTNDELWQFRQQRDADRAAAEAAAAESHQADPVPNPALDIPAIPDVTQFPPQANPVGSTSGEEDHSSAVPGSTESDDTVTRAEVEALKGRIAVLEQHVLGSAQEVA